MSPGPGVNTALFRAGRLERSAVSDVIASPSGSAARMLTVSGLDSTPKAAAGAVTAGARSTLVTVMTVAAVPDRAFAAVKRTV